MYQPIAERQQIVPQNVCNSFMFLCAFLILTGQSSQHRVFSLQETDASISLTYIKKEEGQGSIPVVLHKEQPWGQKKFHLHQ